MQIEIGDNLSISATISIIAIGLMCLCGYGCHQVELTKRTYSEHGLMEVQKEGSTTTLWTKPPNTPPPQ